MSFDSPAIVEAGGSSVSDTSSLKLRHRRPTKYTVEKLAKEQVK